MKAMPVTIYDLGEDIITSLVCQWLDVNDIIALKKTSKVFHAMLSTNVAYHIMFSKVFGTYGPFGIEIRDWKKLYLLHSSRKTKVFTWGHGANGRLGYLVRDVPPAYQSQWKLGVSLPFQLPNFDGYTVQAVLAGGYSFQFLVEGKIYSTGASSIFLRQLASPGPRIKDNVGPTQCHSSGASDHDKLESKFVTQLRIPSDRKVFMISSGRRHFVALDDQGRVLVWDTGMEEWDMGIYLGFGTLNTFFSSVKAGWNSTVCYLKMAGLVTVHMREEIKLFAEFSNWPISEATYSIVPELRNVIDYVALDNCVIFINEAGSLRKYSFGGEPEYEGTDENLVAFNEWINRLATSKNASVAFTKIVGFFRTFAVFADDGLVLFGVLDGKKCKMIIQPKIQNRSIIDIAVGDYHFLAITAKGDLLSWGLELSCNGCLGLGKAALPNTESNSMVKEGADLRASAPTLVQKPTKEGRWVAVCAAGWHSGALYHDDS